MQQVCKPHQLAKGLAGSPLGAKSMMAQSFVAASPLVHPCARSSRCRFCSAENGLVVFPYCYRAHGQSGRHQVAHSKRPADSVVTKSQQSSGDVLCFPAKSVNMSVNRTASSSLNTQSAHDCSRQLISYAQPKPRAP